MKAQIKDIHCSDVPWFQGWRPDSAEDIFLSLQLEIGPQGEEGEDIFSITVTSPEALRARASNTCILAERATMIVTFWDWPIIHTRLGEMVETCEGSHWMELSMCLQRYFLWEYEGMS